MILPPDEVDRLSILLGAMGPVHVKAGHRCVLFTGHRFDLIAAGLVAADELWPGDPGVGSAPRWVQRDDDRLCALSFLARRKAGANRVVIGRLPGDEPVCRGECLCY